MYGTKPKKPHNNRISSSGALKMTGIWKDTIQYDPYEGEGDVQTQADIELKKQQSEQLMMLARLTHSGVFDLSFFVVF